MSEKRFTMEYSFEDEEYVFFVDGNPLTPSMVRKMLNEQQDQISYWKHKVNSLLWILSQFDEERVKKLLKEVEDE